MANMQIIDITGFLNNDFILYLPNDSSINDLSVFANMQLAAMGKGKRRMGAKLFYSQFVVDYFPGVRAGELRGEIPGISRPQIVYR